MQGDVIGIANYNGVIGTYSYDAWGKIIATNSASSTDYNAITANPLRYRGYIYDTETGFYYLQTRYYDPEICRFINADEPEMAFNASITDKNLYAYCDNNPVLRSDEDGELWNVLAGAVIGGAVSASIQIISNLATGNAWDSGLGKAIVLGAAEGALTAIFPGAGGIISASISALDTLSEELCKGIKKDEWDIPKMITNIAVSAAFSYIGGDCGGDFVYGGKMNDAAQAFGTYIKSFFTNNVSRMAKHKSKNIVGKTISKLSKSYLVGTCESLCVSTASDFSSWYLNLGLNYYLGR